MAYWATYIAYDIHRAVAKELINTAKIQLGQLSKRISWLTPDYIHFTMHFLGWLTEEELIKVKKEILKYGNIDIILTQKTRGLGWKASDSYLALEIEKTSELLESHSMIKRNLMLDNIVIKEQEFIPHISLGRIHPSFKEQILNTKLIIPNNKICDIKLSLFKSIENSKTL
ncbi:MAG: hypothetical protein LBK57_08810 [Clostridiales Family XIII bacterium]|jgi:2'-5' RNA ligase|nr:hypothetical protein [Clostridiales Family XIII bacterium]